MENKIKERREELGMTQSELSKKAKVARRVISELETGKREVIMTDTILKISKALDTTPEKIFLL